MAPSVFETDHQYLLCICVSEPARNPSISWFTRLHSVNGDDLWPLMVLSQVDHHILLFQIHPCRTMFSSDHSKYGKLACHVFLILAPLSKLPHGKFALRPAEDPKGMVRAKAPKWFVSGAVCRYCPTLGISERLFVNSASAGGLIVSCLCFHIPFSSFVVRVCAQHFVC